jgi:hypothetical protein
MSTEFVTRAHDLIVIVEGKSYEDIVTKIHKEILKVKGIKRRSLISFANGRIFFYLICNEPTQNGVTINRMIYRDSIFSPRCIVKLQRVDYEISKSKYSV